MENNNLALVIDDEPDLRELLAITLHQMNIKTMEAANIENAKDLLTAHTFQLCLTDMRLPDGDGLELLSYIQKNYPAMPVAMISAHGTIETAIQALKNGAFDFITKPVELDVLRSLIKNALNLSKNIKIDNNELIGNSQQIKNLYESITKLARTEAPILINGPSGSGKELVARLIHKLGPRKDNSFVAINCGAIPRDLVESEFFGYKKGSFTGANQDKIGLFQAADHGTLFLDEIGELPENMQVKLLRAIQEKSIRQIGATEEKRVNVRILSATHQNLHSLVEQKIFREDLYYRINVIDITVPSLKDHIEDLELLINYNLTKIANSLKIKKPQIDQASIDKLKAYNFPGNVRELENILERAATLCNNNSITVDHIKLQPLLDNTPQHSFKPYINDLESYLGNIEKNIILTELENANYSKTNAAKALGISQRTLRYKLNKFGIKE